MNREDRFKSKCFDFVCANYKKVTHEKIVKAKFALSNSACHFNAVAAVNGGRADKVWLIWGGKENGVIHFINSLKGEFFDETWNHYDNQNYYIIRQVDPSEFEGIYDLLAATKRMMFNVNGSFLDRLRIKNKLHNWI